MAINFLSQISALAGINLNQKELAKAQIENQPNDAGAGTGVEGQIYFDTTLDVLKVWAGGTWTEVGGGVTSLTATDGTFIDLTPNTTQGGAATLSADLSATGAPSGVTFLRGDNAWATPIDTNTTYTLPVGSGAVNTAIINLTAGGSGSGVASSVTFSGTTNEIEVTETAGNNGTIVIGLPSNVTVAGALTVSGAGQSSFSGQVTIPTTPVVATDAASKAYVDASVSGALVYQGGYNAATNVPNLDLPPTGTIKKGFMWTVTADGVFFAEQVRVGDSLIAEIDNPTTLADWTTVQSNIDLATLSTVGIGNVNAGTGIGVSYANGTATVTNTYVAPTTAYATTISTSATLTHNLGTKDVIIQLYDTVTNETIYADIARPTINTSTVSFGVVPANPIRVLIQK